MDEQNQNVQKVDLYRIFRLTLRQAKHLWWVALVLALIMAALMGFRSARAYVPMYQATATYAASSGVTGMTDITSSTNYYDTQTREQIVSSFSYIMASEAMQERVKAELGLAYVPGTVSASAVGDTSFFKITATGSDREMTLKLLEAVVKHYYETASFVIGNATIEEMETPRVSTEPINALSVRNSVVKGGALGLLLGIGILVLLAINRKTVESEEDLKGKVTISCLGTLPHIVTKKRRNSKGNLISLLNPNVRSLLEASVGDLRIRLLRQINKQKPEGKLLMITSTFAGEGKTTVSINLAVSLAKSGKRVILVDADLRNQTVKTRFGITAPTRGLLDLVESGDDNLSNYLVQIEDMPLYLMAGDRQMVSPMAQLESDYMGRVLERLRTLADVVILDAPPAGLLVDAAVLGSKADFALYVVRYDGPAITRVEDSIQELQKQKISLLGYVINASRSSGKSGQGNYGSYGGYGSYGKYGYYGKYGKYGSYGSYGKK